MSMHSAELESPARFVFAGCPSCSGTLVPDVLNAGLYRVQCGAHEDVFPRRPLAYYLQDRGNSGNQQKL